jgi:hypothetical protein
MFFKTTLNMYGISRDSCVALEMHLPMPNGSHILFQELRSVRRKVECHVECSDLFGIDFWTYFATVSQYSPHTRVWVTKSTILSLPRSLLSFFVFKNFQISTDFQSITRIPLLLTVVVGEWKHYVRDFASVNFTSLSHNTGQKSVSVRGIPCVS